MDRRLKQRLVGAAVLAALAVIFIPMFLDDTSVQEQKIETTNIPPKPPGEFSSRIIPLDTGQPPAATAPVNPQTTAPATGPGGRGETPPATVTKDAKGADKTPAAATTAAARDKTASDKNKAAGDEAQRLGVEAWVVQLGSFVGEQNARDLEKRLQKEGYSAFVEKIRAAEGNKYRVRVGPELVRAKAQETRDKLEKDLNIKGIVVRYP